MARTKQTARKQLASKAARKGPPSSGRTKRSMPMRATLLTPLHHAAILGNVRILTLLLKREQADMEKKDSRCRTPIHYAVINGHLRAVELLLAHKASVAAKDAASFTALTFAAQRGRLKIFNLLLENGASVSTLCSKACTLLHYAAKCGCVEIAKTLLENGVSPQGQDKQRCTALDYAVYHRHWDVVELLLKEGHRRWISSSQPPTQGDNNPLAATVDDEALIAAMKKENWTNPRKALEIAARLGRDDLVRRLFNEHGCHPHGALYLAVENGHQGCLETLMSFSDDVNNLGPGWESPLECALRLRRDDIAGVLLDAGANPFFDRQVLGFNKPIVALLAKREASVAAQLLSRVPSLNNLSIWLIEIAELKHVSILQEYFRAVVPFIQNKYADQPDPSPTTKLVQHLVQRSRGTLATAPTAADSTSARTSRSLDMQRPILVALDDRFVGVFFLLSIVEPEILSDVLASVPTLREKAGRLLPSRLTRQTDEELIACLSKAGYTLPTPPASPPRPRSAPRSAQDHPAQPPLSPAQLTFHEICEAGYTTEVRRRLQAGGEDVNAVGHRNRTPLHAAAQRGNLEVVKLLVDHGADLTAKTFFGSTAEVLAEKYDRLTVAAFLKTVGTRQRGPESEGSSASQQEPRIEQDQPRDQQNDQHRDQGKQQQQQEGGEASG